MKAHTWGDVIADTKRACDRDDARKIAVQELIATALFHIEHNRPHTAAARLEQAAQTLRLS